MDGQTDIKSKDKEVHTVYSKRKNIMSKKTINTVNIRYFTLLYLRILHIFSIMNRGGFFTLRGLTVLYYIMVYDDRVVI